MNVRQEVSKQLSLLKFRHTTRFVVYFSYGYADFPYKIVHWQEIRQFDVLVEIIPTFAFPDQLGAKSEQSLFIRGRGRYNIVIEF